MRTVSSGIARVNVRSVPRAARKARDCRHPGPGVPVRYSSLPLSCTVSSRSLHRWSARMRLLPNQAKPHQPYRRTSRQNRSGTPLPAHSKPVVLPAVSVWPSRVRDAVAGWGSSTAGANGRHRPWWAATRCSTRLGRLPPATGRAALLDRTHRQQLVASALRITSFSSCSLSGERTLPAVGFGQWLADGDRPGRCRCSHLETAGRPFRNHGIAKRLLRPLPSLMGNHTSRRTVHPDRPCLGNGGQEDRTVADAMSSHG